MMISIYSTFFLIKLTKNDGMSGQSRTKNFGSIKIFVIKDRPPPWLYSQSIDPTYQCNIVSLFGSYHYKNTAPTILIILFKPRIGWMTWKVENSLTPKRL